MSSILNCNPETYCENKTSYLEFLENHENWRSIPLLNYTPLHNLKDLSLVRFRGMIQDMFNPEIYLERYEVKEEIDYHCNCRIQNGKYRDCLVLKSNESVNHDSISNVYGERRTMFVVSIPGINKWASDFENYETTKAIQIESIKSSTSSQKRTLAEHFEKVNIQNIAPDESFQNQHKKVRKDSNTTSMDNNSLLSSEYLLNSPIVERPSKACMIKIYENFDDFTLNSIIEVVGFLSVDPSLDGSTTTTNDDETIIDVSEIHASNPPPSLIPRLHAIAIRKLDHINPLLDLTITENLNQNLNFEVIRNDLKIVLTQCLFGDDVVADYLLSYLISRVYVRTNFETLGQFTLNITNIPSEVLPEYTEKLYEIIESLVPASHYFPMSLDNMNTIQFVPKKDYKTNRLISGLLQLAPHTHLILDETKLQSGKLEANGILGVQNLSHLIKTQQIKCNFEFYEIDFNANIPVLILSEGKSMLPSNIHIPLKISDNDSIKLIFETLKAAKHYLQSKLIDIRKYLTYSKICEDFNMIPNDSKMIEDDFVEMRRTNKYIGSDDLHLLLILSRLIGLSNGKKILDQDAWNMAKKLEDLRRKRIFK